MFLDFLEVSVLFCQVEAVSSEPAVRVRVKVLDNLTSIYSQDIEMAKGEGTFAVPAILSDSDVITLQVIMIKYYLDRLLELFVNFGSILRALQ